MLGVRHCPASRANRLKLTGKSGHDARLASTPGADHFDCLHHAAENAYCALGFRDFVGSAKSQGEVLAQGFISGTRLMVEWIGRLAFRC